MSTIRQSTIQSSKFHGHQGSVLCLDITDDGERAPFLLSGSEDKTARLWDLRDHRRRASLCIQAEGEVLSAAFAPSTPTQQQGTTSLIALEGAFALDFTV
jgi:WD40 repeat protein